MATMTASPGLHQAVLNVLAAIDTWEGRPTKSAAERLLAVVDARDVLHIGTSVGRLLPLLQANPDRLRFALQFINAFDLYEAVPPMVQWLRDEPHHDAILTVAGFAGHPGVSPEVRDVLELVRATIDLDEDASQVFSLRLRPDSTPSSDVLASIKAEVWPGFQRPADSAPVVGIHESSGEAEERWRLALELVDRGAIIRRIPRSPLKIAPKGWFAGDIPVVVGPAASLGEVARTVGVRRLLHAIPTDGRLGEYQRMDVLTRLNQILPSTQKILSRESPRGVDSTDFMDPEVFTLGAFDTHEAAFLAGIRRSTVRYLKTQTELLPRKVSGLNYWNFSQLVGMRVWQYFRFHTPKGRLSPSVADALVRFAGSREARIVGVTATGDVFVREGEELVNALTGQTAAESVVAIDRIFRPFSLGGGKQLPDLVRPSDHTTVHPDVLGGTPALTNHRISARSIHRAFTDGVRSGFRGVDRVREIYPDLTPAEANDAARVGAQVQAAV